MESPDSGSEYFDAKSSLAQSNSSSSKMDVNLETMAGLKARVAVLENELTHQHAKTEAARQSTELLIAAFSKKAGFLSLNTAEDSAEIRSLNNKLKVKERSCSAVRKQLAKEKLKSWYLRARIKSMKIDGPIASRCQNTVKDGANGELDNADLISLAVDSSDTIQILEAKADNLAETQKVSPPSNSQSFVKPDISDETSLKYIHHFVPPGMKSGSSTTACTSSNPTSGNSAKATNEGKVYMPISPETESSKSSFSSRTASKNAANSNSFFDDHANKTQVPQVCYDESPFDFDNDERSRFAKWRKSTNHRHATFEGRKRVDYSDMSYE